MYKFVEKFYIYYYIIPFFLKVGGELMNKELIFKIIDVKKNNNNEGILDILAIFENIINKYSRKLNGEDTKQDLYVFLIKLINNIDELTIINYEDKQVLSYFSKSLKNEYIRLSKKNDREKSNQDYNYEEIVWGHNLIESNIEVLDAIKNLNSYEKSIIKRVVLNGDSVSEVAKKTGKSRQAINQVKNRAISKLKKVYFCLLYTSPSPRDRTRSRMPSSA